MSGTIDLCLPRRKPSEIRRTIITQLENVSSGNRQRAIKSLKAGEQLFVVYKPGCQNLSEGIKVLRGNGEEVGTLEKGILREIIWSYVATLSSRPCKVHSIIKPDNEDQQWNVLIEIVLPTTDECTYVSETLYPQL